MSSSNETPPGGPAGPGRRRPPTIDLQATEVTGDTAKNGEAGSRWQSALAWLPSGVPWPLIAAGASGVAIAAVLLALAGAFSGRDDGAIVLDTRLARVEDQLRQLGGKALPASGDAKAVDELAGRLARLETIIATPKGPVADTALTNRIATLEGELKALGERVGVLGRRNDEIAAMAGEARTRADSAATALAELKKTPAPVAPAATPADVEALSTRVAALERAAKALEAQLAGRATSETAIDKSLRLVVVANALRAAVERGAPFATELSAARAATPDPQALAPLEPYAKSGLPSASTLGRELTALVPALVKTVGASVHEGSILDRLRANAEKIVRVRPIDEATGDDLITVLQRIEIRAQQANLAGALVDIAKLPEPARALTKEWVAKVEARNAALDSSRRFADAALVSIGKPSL